MFRVLVVVHQSYQNYNNNMIFQTFLIISVIFNNISLVRLDCVPLVPRQGIDVRCTAPPATAAGGDPTWTADCFTSYVPEGTIAAFTCSKYYIALKTIEQLPNELICANMTNSGVSKWVGLDLYQSYTCELDCGRPSNSDDIIPFIIKGNNTDSENWPWHASIYKLTSSDDNETLQEVPNNISNVTTNQTSPFSQSSVSSSPSYISNYHCGGTLVHGFRLGFVILTAAHCLLDDEIQEHEELEKSLFQVVLGGKSSNMENNLKNPNAQIFSVEQMYLHEAYNPTEDTHYHDIAIIKLYEPVLLSQWVRPACLSSNYKLVDKMLQNGSKGEVIGFGRRDETNTPSSTLVHATIPVVDKLECFEHLNRDLDVGQICAGYLSEKTSVCSGDSGGGLVFANTAQGTTRYYVQGIVSYGYKNCEKYAVFTKVVQYINWMRFGLESMFEQQEDNQIIGNDNSEAELQVEASTVSSIPQPSCPSIEEIAAENRCDCDCSEKTKTDDDKKSNDEKGEEELKKVIESSSANLEPSITISLPEKNSTRPLSLPPVKVAHELDYPDYQAVALAMHNHYRFLHGSPPVQLNQFLNIEAKRYADKLISENTFVNLNDEPNSNTGRLNYIKNIFELKEFNKIHPSSPSQVVRQAIDHWYSDISQYNWFSPTTSTFSQVVWKSTKEIGVGFSIISIPTTTTSLAATAAVVNSNSNTILAPINNNANFRTVVVVAYSPPGNTIGTDYHRVNVLHPKTTHV